MVAFLQMDEAVAVDGPPPPLTAPPRPPSTSALSVSGLTKSYGSRPALLGVSFELAAGITGLLGPNGAGKSTLLRCLAGLDGWDSGQVRVGGVDAARRLSEARRRIGYMPERVAFPAEMRVAEYLRFVAEAKRVPRRERAAAVEAVLGATGLTGAARRIIGNLSKGYRQRVGVAQALIGEPALLILDEPSAGLDPLSVMGLRDTLRTTATDRAVLVSTHLLSEARLLCDRVIVMTSGRIVYDGPTAGLAGADGTGVQVRIRLRGAGGEEVKVVDAADDDAVGAVVADLVRVGWAVVGVEPTTDSLEDAFRAAVLGDGS